MVSDNSWSEMLPELLESISERLPLADYISFRGVCSSWRSSPSRRAEIANFSKDRLWFMFYDVSNEDDNCYLYTFNNPNCCIFPLPDLKNATVLESKHGWLFAHRDEHFFLLNPFSLEKIDLPNHRVFPGHVCSFATASSTRSPNKTAFIVRWTGFLKLRLSWCHVGSKKWNRQTILVVDDIGTLQVIECWNMPRERLGHNVCVVRGSKKYLIYDYFSRQVMEMGPVLTVHHELDDGLDDFEAYHRKNWLRRFGDDGISFSVSSIMLNVRGEEAEHAGWYPYTDTITPGGKPEEASTLRLLKATWIDAKLNSGKQKSS